MTWRPRYQPQLLHTVCGSRDAPQFGHNECAGATSRMFADLRERVAERLVFRLGTAIDGLLGDLQVERPQGRPTGVEFNAAALAGREVPVDAAVGTQAGTIDPAQRSGRKVEQQRVADQRFEVDDVVVELVGLTCQRVPFVQLVDVHADQTVDRREAAAARGVPGGSDRAPDDDALGDALERDVDVDRGTSAGTSAPGPASSASGARDVFGPRPRRAA